MRIIFLESSLFLLLCLGGQTSCAVSGTHTADIRSDSPPTPTQTITPDFANFSFPKTKDWDAFTLIDGSSVAKSREDMIFRLADRFDGSFGDVSKVAVAILSVQTGGSATPHLMYVFDVTTPKPRLVWFMDFGDRADGGLRSVRLTANKDVEVATYLRDDAVGDCCPKAFTTKTYRLEKKGVRIVNEVKDRNPDQNARFLKSE